MLTKMAGCSDFLFCLFIVLLGSRNKFISTDSLSLPPLSSIIVKNVEESNYQKEEYMYVCTGICAYLYTRITDNTDLGIAANLGTELLDLRTT